MIIPLVSVIIPVYNVENYLEQCLDSVVNQTEKNIEIIVVNDCSPDNSDSIIKQYLEKHINFIYLKHEKNYGVVAARETGLKQAKGEYVLFVDSDDYIMPEMVEKMLLKAKKYNLDCVVCDYVRLVNNKFIPSGLKLLNPAEILDGFKALRKHILINNNCYLWNKLYTKKLYCKTQKMLDTSDMVTNEDALFNFYFFINANRVGTITEILYCYRVNPQSVTQNSRPKHIENLFFCIQTFDKLMKKNEPDVLAVFSNEYQKFKLQRLIIIYLMCHRLKYSDRTYFEIKKMLNSFSLRNIIRNPYIRIGLKIRFIFFKINLLKNASYIKNRFLKV